MKENRVRRLVCALALTISVGVGAQTPERKLSSSTRDRPAMDAQLCADGDRVFVVWCDQRDELGDIYFQRSLDRGESWLASDVRLDTDPPGAAVSSFPRIACAGSVLYVVWLDDREGRSNPSIRMNVSRDSGQTWLSQDIRVNRDATPAAYCPSIHADEMGVYVAWLDSRNGNSDVYLNRSIDHGATWLPADVMVNQSPPGQMRATCSTMIGESGAPSRLYVAWSDFRNGDYDVFLNRSEDGGVTWLPTDRRVDTDVPGSNRSWFPSLAAYRGNVHVAWTDDRNGYNDVYYNHSPDAGLTWQASDVRLDTDAPGAASSDWPVVAVDVDRVYVVWEDFRNSLVSFRRDIFINVSSDGGNTWQPADTRISRRVITQPGTVPAPGRYSDPSAPKVVAGDGRVYVAWNEVRPGIWEDIYSNRSLDGGITWLDQDVRLDADPLANAPSLDVAVGLGNNHVYVAWEDQRRPGVGIYFAQPFALHAFGDGTGVSAPRLAGHGSATIGSTVRLSVDRAPPSGVGVLAVGTTPRVSTPAFGGALHLNPLMVLPVTVDSDGRATLPVPIPDDEALVGEGDLFQFLGIDAAAPAGVSMSNGLELRIG